MRIKIELDDSELLIYKDLNKNDITIHMSNDGKYVYCFKAKNTDENILNICTKFLNKCDVIKIRNEFSTQDKLDNHEWNDLIEKFEELTERQNKN